MKMRRGSLYYCPMDIVTHQRTLILAFLDLGLLLSWKTKGASFIITSLVPFLLVTSPVV